MHTIDDLNLKLLSELKEIADGMGVKNAKKLTKEELVYKILDQQAVSGKESSPKAEASERKMRPRRRENVAPPVAAAVSSAAKELAGEKELSSEEMLQNMDLDISPSVTSFDEPVETPAVQQPEISPTQPREEKPFQNQNSNPNPNQNPNFQQQKPNMNSVRDFDGVVSN